MYVRRVSRTLTWRKSCFGNTEGESDTSELLPVVGSSHSSRDSSPLKGVSGRKTKETPEEQGTHQDTKSREVE